MDQESSGLGAALTAYFEKFDEHVPLASFMGMDPDVLAARIRESIDRGEPLRRNLPEDADA